MKLLLVAFSLSASLLAAAEIPASAVETRPFTWRYTDSKGQVWIYRQTPFGVSRFLDTDTVKAFDQGDHVRFERLSPFGLIRWQTRKSALDEIEQKIWIRTQTQPKQD